MKINSLPKQNLSPDEALSPEAERWLSLREKTNETEHNLDRYEGQSYDDFPAKHAAYSEEDIASYERRYREVISGINSRERRTERYRAYIDGRTPELHSNMLPSEKLENLLAMGIRRYDWLGPTSSGEEAYDEGYIVREIGLAKGHGKQYQILDRFGRTHTPAFDDVVNRIDSAWELACADGETLYLGLDFTINDGRRGKTVKELSKSRSAAESRDATWANKTILSTHSRLKLPFGCSTITFGYTEYPGIGTIAPRKSVRIVPRYAIAIGDDNIDKSYSAIASEPVSGAVLQFKILSQIHEQNQLYLDVINHHGNTVQLTPDEKYTSSMIQRTDQIIWKKLQSCMDLICDRGLCENMYTINDPRRTRRIENLTAIMDQASANPDQQDEYIYNWLKDGSISLAAYGGKTIGRDTAYDESIDMVRQLREALADPENRVFAEKLYGLKDRSRLPFDVSGKKGANRLYLPSQLNK